VAEGDLARLKGDVKTALEAYTRVNRLYPTAVENMEALNRESLMLIAEGRIDEALAATSRIPEFNPIGKSDFIAGFQANLLALLGRFAEARSMAAGLKGAWGQEVEMNVALAECDWDKTDSLARVCEQAMATGGRVLVNGAMARGQIAAVRGAIRDADAHLQSAVTLQHGRGSVLAPITLRNRILLTLMAGTPVPRPEPWVERDTSTSALITRGYLAAASGDTSTARRLLEALRARSTTRFGAHGSTPAFIEAWIAARAGRWEDVVALIAQPARDGSDRGGAGMDRVGAPSERWLVAQAYEHLGRPDSAAAFYSRMLSPSPSFGSSFARQRLVVLCAGMGRIAEAETQLTALERDFTRPDPEVRHLLDEARTAVQRARSIAHRT
jgi:tetratricopeptide (TPR) repeat protein